MYHGFIFNILLEVFTFGVIALYSPLPVHSEGCLNWSKWTDLAGVRNNFVIMHGEVHETRRDVDDGNKCHLLGLDPLEGRLLVR
ncbi:hypothetical protein X943_002227 [Babesia divergens]|uniref:Uncharacterized protein n=1 Tax=Babesia divergens TaxID=32595 RepID=A0AAD9GK06_BABDI|nr:hypothetical protein X943_002227 [Babesia divergens]